MAKRKQGNPARTLANKVGDVRIFLKEFGVTKLLKKNEEPKYHKKTSRSNRAMQSTALKYDERQSSAYATKGENQDRRQSR